MSRTKLLSVFLTVCLVIVYVYVGVDYAGQASEQRVLTTRLSDLTRADSLLPRPPVDLQKRLAEAQRLSAAARESAFPTLANTTQVLSSVLRAADENSISAVPLSTDPWTERRVGERSFRVFHFRLSIKGDLASLLDFVKTLEGGEFKSMVVDNLSVAVVSESSITGTIDLALYALPAEGQ